MIDGRVAWMLALVLVTPAVGQEPGKLNAAPGAAEEAAWRAFAKSLDTAAIEKDYAGAIRNLDSGVAEKQARAVAVLGQTGELAAVPFIVPFIDSHEPTVRVHAALHLSRLVTTIEGRRRNPKRPERVVLVPRKPGDPDLTPLRWVVRRMLTASDESGVRSYAATMASWIGLRDLQPEIRSLLSSRHPANVNAAKEALWMLFDETPRQASVPGTYNFVLARMVFETAMDPKLQGEWDLGYEEICEILNVQLAQYFRDFQMGFRYGIRGEEGVSLPVGSHTQGLALGLRLRKKM